MKITTGRCARLSRVAGALAVACLAGTGGFAWFASSPAGAGPKPGLLVVGNLYTGSFTAYDTPAHGDVSPAATTTGPYGYPYNMVSGPGGVWVAEYGTNEILEYSSAQLAAGGAATPIVTLSGAALDGPVGLAFDATGDLWVVNYGSNTMDEFTPGQLSTGGSPTPAVVISTHDSSLDAPETAAFNKAGDLWVVNASTLVEFTPHQLAATGSPTPARTITSTSLAYPYSLAFSPSGTLWVSNQDSDSLVSFTRAQLASGGNQVPAQTITTHGTSLAGPWEIGFNGNGGLWVANGNADSIVKFSGAQLAAGGSPVPAATIRGPATGLEGAAGLVVLPAS